MWLFNVVNAAIEKLLTFSEDISNHSNALQGVVQEDRSSRHQVEKRSHTIQQYSWMNLPPLGRAKQDHSVTEIPSVTPSSQWRYPHSLHGPSQSVTTTTASASASGDKSSTASNTVVKQLPRQQQALPTHGQGIIILVIIISILYVRYKCLVKFTMSSLRV